MSTTYVTATPEQSLRARCRATWEAGDFGHVAKYNEPAAAEFMERLPLRPGLRVLDLACGTGNLAVLAARAGCSTSGLDIASNLIAQARSRAAVHGLAIEFTEGDAESLPYPPASFDLVISMFGVMFAPRPDQAAAEFLRVCRPGGTIALANWTPEGFIGENFRVTGRHVPPPPGAISPLKWGEEEVVRARLGAHVSDLRFSRRIARLCYPFPPAQTVDFFRQFYGPTLRTFAGLDAASQARLHADLEEMFRQHSQAPDGVTEVRAEYLEVIAVRR
jgi:ubiquinone/menaquinone biosynthesis C-methylase UbiE